MAGEKRGREPFRRSEDGLGVLQAFGLIAAATIVGAVILTVLFRFVDDVLNGVFIDWVASHVLNIWNLNEFGLSADVAFDSVGAKDMLFKLCVAGVFLIACTGVVAARMASKRACERTRAEAAELLEDYIGGERDARSVFPEGFEDLALTAAEIKQDIAERERSLREEASRKNDLITYLAHDLKTPLTSIIGYLSLLDEIPEMPAEQRARYTGIALDKSKRVERLINEFFDITRYNLQNIELELARFDLSFMLAQMADEFYPLLEAHGNTVTVEVDGERVTVEEPGAPLMVMADADRLARVFNNLLKNAIAYSDAGTEIAINAAAEPDASAVRIEVSDCGLTIPSHKLKSIFDKFFRVDEARVSATGGAGLGLAIAREIVELHGGTIEAQSEKGLTTFTVELPIC